MPMFALGLVRRKIFFENLGMAKKISTDGKSSGISSINDAFGSLHIDNLPQAETQSRRSANSKPSVPEKLGKVHLRIEKSGRSGKTVTILEGPGIVSLAPEKRADLLKALKQKFACGGAEVGNSLELQGDDRDRVRLFLQMLGYN